MTRVIFTFSPLISNILRSLNARPHVPISPSLFFLSFTFLFLLFSFRCPYSSVVRHWLPGPQLASFKDVLVLFSALKHRWSQIERHVSMSLAAVFRLGQGSCSGTFFQAWKLSQEYRQAVEWYSTRLPPKLLAVEQQQLSGNGSVAWQPVQGTVRLCLGVPVRLRCWIWGAQAQQYVWSANGTAVPAAPTLCPQHNVFKSEVTISAPGVYQCVATSADGRSSEPTTIEVN